MDKPTTQNLEIGYNGFWLCRLATDPDPSDELRGVSGFTWASIGESDLEPSLWTQQSDVLDEFDHNTLFERCIDSPHKKPIKNIRDASPDFQMYNKLGINVSVNNVTIDGKRHAKACAALNKGKIRFLTRNSKRIPSKDQWSRNHIPYRWRGPIFEGRNQIVSDGDYDRFTLNPFVIDVSDPINDKSIIRRFDPLDKENPDAELWQISDPYTFQHRLPHQRFNVSNQLLNTIGVNDPDVHFQLRLNWLKSKVLEFDSLLKSTNDSAKINTYQALKEYYQSRAYCVNFFTNADGVTVKENRLASRIPLKLSYNHKISGSKGTNPPPFADQSFFKNIGLKVDSITPWSISYYFGAYDGDLMVGYTEGSITIPVSPI